MILRHSHRKRRPRYLPQHLSILRCWNHPQCCHWTCHFEAACSPEQQTYSVLRGGMLTSWCSVVSRVIPPAAALWFRSAVPVGAELYFCALFSKSSSDSTRLRRFERSATVCIISAEQKFWQVTNVGPAWLLLPFCSINILSRSLHGVLSTTPFQVKKYAIRNYVWHYV